MVVRQHVGARVGIVGNPSDGFGGKTISCLIANSQATITLRDRAALRIVHHPVYDPVVFNSLYDLACASSFDGYYSGIQLLYASCKKFWDYCEHNDITLPNRNFSIEYDTTIPRQVGLAGSSAIIAAAVKALMAFYELDDSDIPRPVVPNLVLAVETEELGIVAGLQDRVAQVYGGLVYMDFGDEFMAGNGHGYYESLGTDLLPTIYLAYCSEGSESGSTHSPVKDRYERADEEVLDAITQWREYTEEGREAILNRDYGRLGKIMDKNFDLRRKVYGDRAIGDKNLEMVETARSLGLPAKFAGSGGAIIGICESPEELERARTAFGRIGCYCTTIIPTEASPTEVDKKSEATAVGRN